jgi:phosphoglycolate phosphatase
MTIKAILFDKDGTLLDFDATFAPATASVLKDLSGGDDTLKQNMAQAVAFDFLSCTIAPGSVLIAGSLDNIGEALMPFFNGCTLEDLRARIDTLYVKYSLETLAPFAYLDASLSALEKMNLALGIATNDSENAATSHMEKLGMTDRFCFMAGFDSGFGEKPEPGMVQAYVDHLQLTPKEVMMVGDSTHDCMAGKASGAVTVGVLSGHAPAHELMPHADHVVTNISALPELIQKLNG